MIAFNDETGHTVYYYDASDCAKFLAIKDTNGKILGRNKFLQFLRANGAIMKNSNQPSMAWINMGLAKWHTTTKRWKTYGMPIFSEKALGYIRNKIDSGQYQVEFQKKVNKHIVKLQDIC